MSQQPEAPVSKTIKLVVPPQYYSLGYRDYTATLSLQETPSVLKRAGSQIGPADGMTLLFRGRRITPEEEHISFQDLMKKFGVGLDVEVLVFHCVLHPNAVAMLSAAQKQSSSNTIENTQMQQGIGASMTEGLSRVIPGQSTSASATSTGVQLNSSPPTQHPQQYAPPTTASPQPGQSQQPYSIPIQGQSPQTQTTQAAIHQTITQLTAQPPVRPNIQVVPIQYQGLLINGLPFLVQIQRPPQIRLPSDQVIQVSTHEGQQAYILSPQGVSSLAQQGYQVEIRVFNRQTGQPAAPAGVVGQQPPPQGGGQQQQQQGQRFGLTDFVSLFRRRLGQQLWLMCKLAFMVGVFSSNNASWRRIAVLCLAAAGIFCELERWGRRFRRPILPPRGITHDPQPNQPPLNLNTDPNPTGNTETNTNTAPPAAAVVQEGPMAAVTAGLRLAEQVLFVFVASLWPNAVAAEGGAGVGIEEEGEGEGVGNEPDDGMMAQ